MKPIPCNLFRRAVIILCSFLSCHFLFAQNWSSISGIQAKDIAVGKKGDVWATATNSNIYRWTGSSWQAISGGASRIAVDSSGNPWVVNGDGNIYKYTISKSQWEMKTGLATDIGAGAD